jgi:hypothetical protein
MTSMESKRDLTSSEREIVGRILTAFCDANLLAQLDHAQAIVGDGPPMIIDFVVDSGSARSSQRNGPVPINTLVTSPAGVEYGEILVWVTDGYLSGIEHPWWSDDMPTSWPDPVNVTIVGPSSLD